MCRPDGPTAQLRTPALLKRAAVYCRVSTDESLHLEFNSLHAQREACEAYIKSQQHEGWTLVPTLYDDGGFSGGTMDRPALARLLSDVAAGLVDTIVVYKIDRLTRALADFAKIVDVLDSAKASFVSVTQAFNTTTSMGRLTLNVLLSFAQFEREVGAERVRDKIAASKKKGIWMGGVCPLGYDAKDRKLVINEAEAETVRQIFGLYLKLKSVLSLEDALVARKIHSKVRVRKDGVQYGGCRFTRGALYALLQNRIYIGQTCHRGAAYPGQHEGIVDEQTFAEAQRILSKNRVERQQRVTANEVSLLTGLTFDSEGRRLSPTHTKKGPARYRYYSARPGPDKSVRVAAAELERVVIKKLSSWLANRRGLDDLLQPCGLDAVAFEAVLFAATDARTTLASNNAHNRRHLIQKLVSRVEVQAHQVRLHVMPQALLDLARIGDAANGIDVAVELVVPVRMFRRAREIRLAIPPDAAPDAPQQDPALIKLITRAWAARQAVFNGGGASLREVAASQGCDVGYFTVLVKLGFLSPTIVLDVLNGRQPPEVTRQRLARMRKLPMDWVDQGNTLSAVARRR